MTVFDLASTNWQIGEIDIDLREPSGKLIKTYRVGSFAREYNSDGPNTEIIVTQLNHAESADGWGLIDKNLPKHLGELVVDVWIPMTGPKIKSHTSTKLVIHAHDPRPMFGGSDGE